MPNWSLRVRYLVIFARRRVAAHQGFRARENSLGTEVDKWVKSERTIVEKGEPMQTRARNYSGAPIVGENPGLQRSHLGAIHASDVHVLICRLDDA